MRNKWKTIRDGYTKFKKQLKCSTGSSRKNINYTWASQLSFLDNFNVPRASSSNISITSNTPQPSRAQTPSIHSDDLENSTSQLNSSPIPSTSSSSQISPSSEFIPPSPFNASTSIPSTRKNKRASENRRDNDDVGRVLDFLNSKKKKEYDVVDNLFLSYADTFKKFPAREQALVKLELAKLFTNTELQLLDNRSANNSNFQYASNVSPAYTTTSSVENHAYYSPKPQPINLSGDNNNSATVANSGQLFENEFNDNLPQLNNYDIIDVEF